MIVLEYIIKFAVISFPVFCAGWFHMAIVKFDWFAKLKIPLDMNRKYRGERIFGDHKTVRGIVVMVALSIVFTYLLEWMTHISPTIQKYCLLDFDRYSPLWYGILYGLGYTLFELPNSFVKRRRKIPPGKSAGVVHVVVDQADSVVGCLLFIGPFSAIDLPFFIFGVVFFTFFHMGINYLMYVLKLRKNPL